MKKFTSSNGRPITLSRQRNLLGGLFEVHYPSCDCSYCKTISGFGRKAPGMKAWNAWWVLHAEAFAVKYYFRYHSIFYRSKP